MQYGLLVAGLALLVLGAELLVRGGVGLAERFGVSHLLIGLTVVAWGTSAPELVVALQSALGGAPDITLGNVVGSNIFNVLAILGLAALIRPIRSNPRAVVRDALAGLVAAVAMWWIAEHRAHLSFYHGVSFVVALLIYTILVYEMERAPASHARPMRVGEVEEHEPASGRHWINVLLIVLGLAGLVGGSKLLVDNAVVIARNLGVSEAVIGLSLVAAGTSLPELATSAVAAMRGHSAIALGNVLGSNIYNLLAILGITAMVAPVPIPQRVAHFDIYLLVAVAIAAMVPVFSGGRLGRLAGFLFLACYAVYVGLLLGQTI